MTNSEKIEVGRLRKLGFTQAEVAAKMGYSLRTIKRVDRKKAEIADFPEQDEEIFSDPEEGWESSYSKEIGARTPDSASWNFIVYPESAPDDWREQLIAWGCPLMIGPLHDRDRWHRDDKNGRYKADDLKIEHWHCNVKLGKKITLKKASMMIQRITHGPIPQPCEDEAGLLRYVVHRHRDGTAIDGKFQYSEDDIQIYNGWKPEPTEQDRAVMRLQLERYLTVEGIDNYTIAVNRVRTELGTDFSKLMRQDAHHFRGMIEANKYVVGKPRERLIAMIEREMAEEREAERFWEENQNSKQQEDKKDDESADTNNN